MLIINLITLTNSICWTSLTSLTSLSCLTSLTGLANLIGIQLGRLLLGSKRDKTWEYGYYVWDGRLTVQNSQVKIDKQNFFHSVCMRSSAKVDVWRNFQLYTLFFFNKNIVFFRPRLNILIFLPILGWKYSCIILKLLLMTFSLGYQLQVFGI